MLVIHELLRALYFSFFSFWLFLEIHPCSSFTPRINIGAEEFQAIYQTYNLLMAHSAQLNMWRQN